MAEGTEYGCHSYLELLKPCRSNIFVHIQFFKLLVVKIGQESEIVDAFTLLKLA